jgi:hypothetical protein
MQNKARRFFAGLFRALIFFQLFQTPNRLTARDSLGVDELHQALLRIRDPGKAPYDAKKLK